MLVPGTAFFAVGSCSRSHNSYDNLYTPPVKTVCRTPAYSSYYKGCPYVWAPEVVVSTFPVHARPEISLLHPNAGGCSAVALQHGLMIQRWPLQSDLFMLERISPLAAHPHIQLTRMFCCVTVYSIAARVCPCSTARVNRTRKWVVMLFFVGARVCPRSGAVVEPPSSGLVLSLWSDRSCEDVCAPGLQVFVLFPGPLPRLVCLDARSTFTWV